MTAIALVPKPTAAEETRREVIERLQAMLAAAEAGDLVEVFAVVKYANGNWASVHSSCTDMAALIGRLEMAKQEKIAEYLAAP